MEGIWLKILVTGASGFIGGHLVELLVEKGYDVIGMVRKTSDTSLLDELDVKKRIADLTEPQTLKGAVSGVDGVIHLAAYYTFHGKKELYERVNVKGTRYLLEACLREGVQRFVYCSTTEVIGPVKEIPAREDHPPNPQYEYGRSKLRAERVVKEYGDRIKTTIIRPSGVYGPRNVDDISYYFITSFARNALPTRIIVGSGKNVVQFAHVKDVVQGFYLALEREESWGQTYFITEDKWYSYLEVYDILAEITGREPPTVRVPKWLAKALVYPVHLVKVAAGKWDFMWDPKTVDAVTSDRAYSIEKAKRELGYSSRYSLRDGLSETVEWYREKGIIRSC